MLKMVVDESTRKEQTRILGLLFEVNNQIDNEYEAHNLISKEISKLKEESNFENFSVTMIIKDISKIGWKQNKRAEKNEFTKIFFNEIEHAKQLFDLKRKEINFMYSISEYLLWEKNLLVDREGIPLNQKRLAEELELDRKTIFNYTKSLEQKKCLIRIWDGRLTYYLVNPYLMFRGKTINKSIPEVFKLIGFESM